MMDIRSVSKTSTIIIDIQKHSFIIVSAPFKHICSHIVPCFTCTLNSNPEVCKGSFLKPRLWALF